jgi:hypothetical protein
MKKIILTGITAALFSFAAVAQQQDSTQTPGNQYQQSNPQQQNPAAVDTASTQYQQGDQYQQQRSDQNQQDPGNQFNQDANQSRDSVNQNDMERSDQIRQNPEQSQDMQPGQPQSENNMNYQRSEDSDTTLNQMNDQFRSSVQGEAMTAPDVEVVKDKEGPDNEVVYQYQGDLYYIDRDKKELVKAKESELQDAKHDVIVEEGNANSNNDNSYNDRENTNNDGNTYSDNNSRSDRK